MEADPIFCTFLNTPGVYVHVPFCRSICPFCPYNKERYQPVRVRAYFAALREEVDRYTAGIQSPFTSLYIGGGTPSLCLEELEPIIAALPVQGERAIEILPSHATPERLDRMQEMGITYISLGIQSFQKEMLRYLKRPTTVEENFRALRQVAGRFECVDVDLLFDVSFADESVFLWDLEICLANGADQISTYPLMRFGYTPFGKGKHDRHKEHAVLRKAEEVAGRYGYERRSVWTFNRQEAPNYTSVTRPFYLGLGAGSASYSGHRFWINHFSVDRYLAKVRSGQLPMARAYRLPRFISSCYAAFWQAYTGQIDTDQLTAYFGYLPGLWWRALFQMLAHRQWVTQNQALFSLTSKGRDRYHDLERWVTYHFIEPLWKQMMAENPPGAEAILPEQTGCSSGWQSLPS